MDNREFEKDLAEIENINIQNFDFSGPNLANASDFLVEAIDFIDNGGDDVDYDSLSNSIISEDENFDVTDLLKNTDDNDTFNSRDIIGGIIKKLRVDENIGMLKRTVKNRNEQEILDLVIMMSNYSCEGKERELTDEEKYMRERMRASQERKERMEAKVDEERFRREEEARKMAESVRIAKDKEDELERERKRQEELEQLERKRQEELERLERERLENERLEEERRRMEAERLALEEERRKLEEELRLAEEAKNLAEEKRLLEEQRRKLEEANLELQNDQPDIDFDEDESQTYSLKKLEKKDFISDNTLI